MKPEGERDYTDIAAIAARFGFKQAFDRMGAIRNGFFVYKDTRAQVDLTACACTEEAVIKTALDQLAEEVDSAHNHGIEHDLNS